MRISGFLYSRLFATVATCGLAMLHHASAQTSAPISLSQPTQSMADALRQVAAASQGGTTAQKLSVEPDKSKAISETALRPLTPEPSARK